MTRIALLFALSLMTVSVGHAEPTATAKEHYAAVNRDLKSCQKVPMDLSGYSTEGGHLVAYLKGKQVRKLSATYYGESGQAQEDFYFWQGRLFFVLKSNQGYSILISQPGSPGKLTRWQERLYFENGQLTRWASSPGAVNDIHSKAAKTVAQETLSNSRELLLKVKNATTPPSGETQVEAAILRARLSSIQSSLANAEIIKQKITPNDDEPGEFTAYLRNGRPAKIVTRYNLPDGRSTNEFYFWQGRLFLAVRSDWDAATDSGVKGAPRKENRLQQRFYFSNGHLTRWLSDNGDWNELTTTAAIKAEKDLINEMHEVQRELRHKLK